MLKTVIFGFITDIKCGWSLTKIITSQFAWNGDAWLFQRILAFDGRSQDCHSYFTLCLCVIQVNPITVHFSTSMKPQNKSAKENAPVLINLSQKLLCNISNISRPNTQLKHSRNPPIMKTEKRDSRMTSFFVALCNI